MQTKLYHTVTYDVFYEFMSKVTGLTTVSLYKYLSYNDAYFEEGVAQFIELGHSFSEAMEECNRESALLMNAALDEFMKSKGITTILII